MAMENGIHYLGITEIESYSLEIECGLDEYPV